ncbi:MAG: hypothetical protein U0974_13200 [Gemmatimonadales bacterium]|nr:hypothetical protein [Gemmatimonadales bacterium]
MLLFLMASLGVTMALAQDYEEEGGLIFWLLVLPVVILPMTRPMLLLEAMRGRALIMVLFLLFAGGWQAARGDWSAVLHLSVFIWGVIWVSSDQAKIKFDDLYLLYAAAIGVGVVIWLSGELNLWGVIPGTTLAAGEAVWRVSFFPNIAYTGFFSLAFLMIYTRDPRPKGRYALVFLLAAYFIVFSFVRTAIISLVIYFALTWLFRRKASPSFLFWVALLTSIGATLLIAYSGTIFAGLQNNAVFSRTFFRGETGLSTAEIYDQIYRPWLWGQHLRQFATSPFLMGWGETDFYMRYGGDVSLPTRLLAQFGLPALLFIAFVIGRLAVLAKRGDAWGCACFPAIIMVMTQWGTMFHPTDAMFALYMIILVHGASAFGPRLARGMVVNPRLPKSAGAM